MESKSFFSFFLRLTWTSKQGDVLEIHFLNILKDFLKGFLKGFFVNDDGQIWRSEWNK